MKLPDLSKLVNAQLAEKLQLSENLELQANVDKTQNNIKHTVIHGGVVINTTINIQGDIKDGADKRLSEVIAQELANQINKRFGVSKKAEVLPDVAGVVSTATTSAVMSGMPYIQGNKPYDEKTLDEL